MVLGPVSRSPKQLLVPKFRRLLPNRLLLYIAPSTYPEGFGELEVDDQGVDLLNGLLLGAAAGKTTHSRARAFSAKYTCVPTLYSI